MTLRQKIKIFGDTFATMPSPFWGFIIGLIFVRLYASLSPTDAPEILLRLAEQLKFHSWVVAVLGSVLICTVVGAWFALNFFERRDKLDFEDLHRQLEKSFTTVDAYKKQNEALQDDRRSVQQLQTDSKIFLGEIRAAYVQVSQCHQDQRKELKTLAMYLYKIGSELASHSDQMRIQWEHRPDLLAKLLKADAAAMFKFQVIIGDMRYCFPAEMVDVPDIDLLTVKSLMDENFQMETQALDKATSPCMPVDPATEEELSPLPCVETLETVEVVEESEVIKEAEPIAPIKRKIETLRDPKTVFLRGHKPVKPVEALQEVNEDEEFTSMGFDIEEKTEPTPERAAEHKVKRLVRTGVPAWRRDAEASSIKTTTRTHNAKK